MEESSEVTVEKLLEKTIELLEDRCKEVQVASAISLFAMDKSTSKVIIHTALFSFKCCALWTRTFVQCFAAIRCIRIRVS